MVPESVRMAVLRVLVHRMGPDKLVTCDHHLLESLVSLDPSTVRAAIDDLANLAFTERVADDLYRVTSDGERAIPTAPDQRPVFKRMTMSEERAERQRRAEERGNLLAIVFQMTRGNVHARVPMQRVFEEAALSYEEGRAISNYLYREGLLVEDQGHTLGIQHEGVKAYEESLDEPGEPAAPPVVIHQTFHNVGSIQTGGRDNVAHVSQAVGVPSGDLVSLVAQLRAKAHEHGDEVAIATADKVHEHASSVPPNTEKMTLYLKMLTAVAELAPYASAALHAISGVGA
jgi:predicted transcriptional regulator